MVPTFVCPADTFRPSSSSSNNRKRKAGSSSQNDAPTMQNQNQARGAVGGQSQRNVLPKIGNEISEIMGSIREFSSSTFQGQAKIKHKDDKLVKLGAAPMKKQTMPLKMAIGIQKGREKRAAKTLMRAKESGTVLARSKTANKDRTNDKSAKSRDSADFNINASGGVLHLDRKRVSQKLISKGLSAAAKSNRDTKKRR